MYILDRMMKFPMLYLLLALSIFGSCISEVASAAGDYHDETDDILARHDGEAWQHDGEIWQYVADSRNKREADSEDIQEGNSDGGDGSSLLEGRALGLQVGALKGNKIRKIITWTKIAVKIVLTAFAIIYLFDLNGGGVNSFEGLLDQISERFENFGEYFG